jgi:chromosome segregation ATPase
MADPRERVLEEQGAVVYSGEGISVRLLEETIGEERRRQDAQIGELEQMRQKNVEIQHALADEMARLKELAEELARGRKRRGLVSWLPWFRKGVVSRRSVEELLRNQFEMSSLRLRQASEFADRLEAAKEELYDEIDRLNQKIVESAENEERAAALVLELRGRREAVESELAALDASSAQARQLQRDLDRVARGLAEHTTKLKLYGTAEERLAALRTSTRQLAETIAALQGDITNYVVAAGEKLDLVAGQIQAVGAAADASLVMLELKQSLEAMTESINQTTRFVAETQAYFRENVDSMIDELRLYDEETQRVLEENLSYSQSLGELDVERALSAALERAGRKDREPRP